MAGVAINGSKIKEVIKPNHVTYNIDRWGITGGGYCNSWDVDGNCNGWADYDYGWIGNGTGSTGAKIIGVVAVSSSKMKLSGTNVAKVGDLTNETWVADPPIPTTVPNSVRYTATSPISGSGQGSITSGSSKGKLEGSAIALIGSQVTTHLGVVTTIEDGSTKMNYGS